MFAYEGVGAPTGGPEVDGDAAPSHANARGHGGALGDKRPTLTLLILDIYKKE
jgi:hypothetical protein